MMDTIKENLGELLEHIGILVAIVLALLLLYQCTEDPEEVEEGKEGTSPALVEKVNKVRLPPPVSVSPYRLLDGSYTWDDVVCIDGKELCSPTSPLEGHTSHVEEVEDQSPKEGVFFPLEAIGELAEPPKEEVGWPFWEEGGLIVIEDPISPEDKWQ